MKKVISFENFVNEQINHSLGHFYNDFVGQWAEMLGMTREEYVAHFATMTVGIDESLLINEDWGSSDQAAMNKAIHRDLGNPRKMMSPFDPKLRSAVGDAVDFWWDEWEEYTSHRDGLVDHAVKMYLRAYFPKEWDALTRMFS